MQIKILVLIVILAVTIFIPNASNAQTPDTTQLQAFTKGAFYQGLLKRIFAGIPETVFKRCPTLVSKESHISVGKPVTFAASGYPNSGSWKQSFPVSGCGNDMILNIFLFAKADEKIDTIGGLPGTTIADFTLQRDGLLYAGIGAHSLVKDCKFNVKNTKFEAFGLAKPPTPDPGPNQHFRPWWETWTMVGCGRTIDVPIDFIPDNKGTTIVQPGGAVER